MNDLVRRADCRSIATDREFSVRKLRNFLLEVGVPFTVIMNILLSRLLRSVSTVSGHWRPTCLKRCLTTSHSVNPEDLQEVEDFGVYNVILPEEPFVWGVSHITLRPVPDHIVRPRYALQHDRSVSLAKSETVHEEHYDGDGRIKLGSVEEKRVRAAATFARNVRNYAGSLVQVSTVSISDVDTT